MLTAHDVYAAWLDAYAAYTQAYHQAGIAVPLPGTWEDLTAIQKQMYAHMAALLNDGLGLWAMGVQVICASCNQVVDANGEKVHTCPTR